jgi:hypothetical protein
MKEPPKVIYLQWYGEDYFDDNLSCDPDADDVTWCQDRINDTDLKYILDETSTYTEVRELSLPNGYIKEL